MLLLEFCFELGKFVAQRVDQFAYAFDLLRAPSIRSTEGVTVLQTTFENVLKFLTFLLFFQYTNQKVDKTTTRSHAERAVTIRVLAVARIAACRANDIARWGSASTFASHCALFEQ